MLIKITMLEITVDYWSALSYQIFVLIWSTVAFMYMLKLQERPCLTTLISKL